MPKRYSRKYLVGLTFILLLAFGLYWGASFLIMNRITLVDPKCERRSGEYAYTPANFSYKNFGTSSYFMNSYETVRFPSRTDDITISAWFIPNQDAPTASQNYPTVIIVHGFSDCRHRPFSLIPAGMLTHNGFNVLAIDLRDHGDSEIEDGRMAAGTNEYLDILGAWDWLILEKGMSAEKIGLFGYSLGGTSVMIAAGKESRIAAVWDDSGFSDYEREIEFLLPHHNFPKFLSTGVQFTYTLVTDDSLTALTAYDEMLAIAPRPVYIVHGTADTTVPLEESKRLVDAYNSEGGNISLWIVPDTEHIEAMLNDSEGYQERLLAFFREHLETGENR